MKENQEIGRIAMNGATLEPHEYETVSFLAGLGKDIEIILRSQTPNMKNPDFFMDGLVWEAKSPIMNEKRALERLFYRASTQSSNLIFDLRRLKGRDIAAARVVEVCFRNTRRVRNMYVIMKEGDLRRYKKK